MILFLIFHRDLVPLLTQPQRFRLMPGIQPCQCSCCGFFTNKLFLIIMAGIALVEFVLIQFCGKFFAAEALSKNEWIFSVVMGLLCVPYGIVMRALPIPIFTQIVNIVNSTKNLFKSKAE